MVTEGAPRGAWAGKRNPILQASAQLIPRKAAGLIVGCCRLVVAQHFRKVGGICAVSGLKGRRCSGSRSFFGSRSFSGATLLWSGFEPKPAVNRGSNTVWSAVCRHAEYRGTLQQHKVMLWLSTIYHYCSTVVRYPPRRPPDGHLLKFDPKIRRRPSAFSTPTDQPMFRVTINPP